MRRRCAHMGAAAPARPTSAAHGRAGRLLGGSSSTHRDPQPRTYRRVSYFSPKQRRGAPNSAGDSSTAIQGRVVGPGEFCKSTTFVGECPRHARSPALNSGLGGANVRKRRAVRAARPKRIPSAPTWSPSHLAQGFRAKADGLAKWLAPGWAERRVRGRDRARRESPGRLEGASSDDAGMDEDVARPSWPPCPVWDAGKKKKRHAVRRVITPVSSPTWAARIVLGVLFSKLERGSW